jgi:hypothetical protein
MRSLSAERNAFLVRILITISPRLYREAIALSIHRHRPDFEVLLAPTDSLDGEAERFAPHALVQDADEEGLPPGVPDGLVCRVQVLKTTERMDAAIKLGGATSELRDVTLQELFAALEEAESLSQGDDGG